MRVRPVIDIVVDEDYDPAGSTDIQEIEEYEKAGLANGSLQPYGIRVWIADHMAAALYGVVTTSGHAGRYELGDITGDDYLDEQVTCLVQEACESTEVEEFYIVAASPSGARWAYEAHIRHGAPMVHSDDLGYAQEQAEILSKINGTKYRVHKMTIRVSTV